MSQTPHISRFTLERWLTGELPEEAAHEAKQHVEACGECQSRTEAIRADQAVFAEEIPYANFRIEHEQRMTRRGKKGARRLWLLVPALAAAAAGLLVFALPEDPVAPIERIKGPGVALSLFGAAGEPLPSGRDFAAGSRIQLAYDAGPHAFLALVGIDAAGNVSTYYPERGTRLAPLPSAEEGLFPFGLELDDTRGIERFFLVLADRPEPLTAVLAAARSIAHTDLHRTDRLPLPPGFAQATVWLRKPEGPQGN